MPKKPSKFWMFFQKIDRNTAECRLCGKHLRTCGNTTNLGKHIKRHPNYRELANQSGDSDDEKHPIKSEKLWTPDGHNLDDDNMEFTETIFDEKTTEAVYIPQDPLLENEGTSGEVKVNVKELKRATESSANISFHLEKRVSTSDSSKRIKLEPVASSSSAVIPSQAFNTEATHLAFAEFFFACNIPFKVLNSVHLKRFISKLNKLYRPPSLRELSTTYLDRAYDKYKTPMPSQEQDAVLLLSGWKDFTSSEKCIVACLYLTGDSDSRVFLNTWDLNIDFYGENENEQKAIIDECSKLAKDVYNAKIYAVISDNIHLHDTPNMVYYWNTMCHSYLAGCLVQDVVDENDARKVKQVLQEFQQEENEALIVERGGSRVLLPWEKRWCTYRDSFQCYVRNNQILRDLITEQRCAVHPYIRDAIFSDELVIKIQRYIAVLEPLCKLIYLSQKKKTTLADVAEEWIRLVFPEEFEPYLQCRRNMALTPFALAANFMHPTYRGRCINDNQMEAVEFFFLDNLDSKGLDDMFSFKKNDGIFQMLAEKQVTTCNTYWGMAGRKHPQLTALAKRLLSIPASVSYIEKIFSSWSTTHLAARNLLGMDIYRKLTKTHFVLNLSNAS